MVLDGTAITIAAFLWIRSETRGRRIRAFDEIAAGRAAAVVRSTEEAVVRVRGAATYLATNPFLEDEDYGTLRPEFRLFGAELASGAPDLFALGWVPRVAGDDRDAFLLRARPVDGSPFDLTELGPDDAVVPAQPRAVHFPLTIVGPIPPRPLRGVDLGARPELRARLVGSLRTGAVVADLSDGILPRTGAGPTLLVLVPLALRPTVTEAGSERTGFALGLIDLPVLLRQALGTLAPAAVEVELRDDATGRSLWGQGGEDPSPAAAAGYERRSPLRVGDRAWTVVVRATPAFRPPAGSNGWLVLIGGLLATAALARYLAVARRREEAQTELAVQRRETAAHLKAIFDVSLDAIVSADDHGTISEWNASAERLFGWPADEVMGLTLADTIIPPEDRVGHRAALAGLRATGKSPSIGRAFEYEMVRRDGSRVPVELVMTPTPIGGAPRITAFIEDISHRKAAEAATRRAHEELEDRVRHRTADLERATEQLGESEQRLRLMMENAGDAVYLSDPEGRIVDINRTACVMLGYDRDELLALHIADVETRADRSRPVGPRLAALQPGEVMTSEGERRRKGGAMLPVEVRVGPVDWGGERLYLALARDVTERRAMEAAMAAARDAALEASRLKSDFLANMSHEIRTPLNGILGMTGLLLDSDLSQAQREDLEIVRQSGEHLLALINDILDLARIEAGRFHIDSAPFDLEDVLHGVAGLLSAAAERKRIEFILRIAPDTPRVVVGDAARLRQVLVNLAGNAVKFTDSGHVLLEAECTAAQRSDGATLRFAVADTGIGIAADALARVFEKFTQADQSTQRRYGSAGLGLTISRQIVEAMGGHIHATSTPGAGSEFSFKLTLPVGEAPPRRTGADELAGVRALIVDDNPVNRRVLKEQLTSWRLRATAVASPAEALAELRAGAWDGDPYRIALLDFQMEEMDGLELAGRIQGAGDIETPLILLLSSVGRHFDSQIVARAGIARWLTKPVSPSDLFNTITEGWAGRERRARPRGAPAAPVVPHARVLLAEDSLVNQRVAVRNLQKLGCEVDVASTGAEAVAMSERTSHAMIFMDCQMPEMDGYEATRRIRVREGTAQHTPIVALTAHALAGDRERCLAAGMDDYLSKPVAIPDLLAVVTRYAGSGAAPATEPALSAPPAAARIDAAAILAMVDHEAPVVAELARLFEAQAIPQLAELSAAGDADAVRRLGHALKSSAATLYARGAAALAHDVEEAGRSGNVDAARSLSARLAEEVRGVQDELNALARGMNSGTEEEGS